MATDLDSILSRAAGIGALFINRNHIPWEEAEMDVVRAWYGRVPKAELAKKVSAVRGVRRTPEAVYQAAVRLGLDPRIRDDETCLTTAAESAGISYHIAYRAARAGNFDSRKIDKFRVVKKNDPGWDRWREQFLARREAEQAALAAITETHISKQEAMKALNLRETHLTRYLTTGVLKAWKIPQGENGRGYWRISQESVDRVLAMRREGRLVELLNATPGYRQTRSEMNEQINALRHNQRVGQGDPLTTPMSAYLPGCFTIIQVARHVGLSAQAVYAAIESGTLKAVSVIAGGRRRYAIEPEEARRYAQYVIEREDPAVHWHKCRRDDIIAAGLLTAADLAGRWGCPLSRIYFYSRRGCDGDILTFRTWGRYRVYERADIEAFETRHGLTGR
jgi:hypothetical protein